MCVIHFSVNEYAVIGWRLARVVLSENRLKAELINGCMVITIEFEAHRCCKDHPRDIDLIYYGNKFPIHNIKEFEECFSNSSTRMAVLNFMKSIDECLKLLLII